MPTLYWCPHQVLKATGAPAPNQLLALEFMYSYTCWKDALGFTNPIDPRLKSLFYL